jgi:hypothetical protein
MMQNQHIHPDVALKVIGKITETISGIMLPIWSSCALAFLVVRCPHCRCCPILEEDIPQNGRHQFFLHLPLVMLAIPHFAAIVPF